MKFDSISPKQAEIFKFGAEDYDALICDGAVRSGKTIMMVISFIIWGMEKFNGCNFGICGKTVRSAERNIIMPLMQITSMTKKYNIVYTRSLSLVTISHKGKTNYFYIFGGKDESSYTLIQGITLCGVLFDEVALMPRSFVDQAISRTLSVDNSKLWFNCNPDNPKHWFYLEWVLEPQKHNAKHLHFLMDDNPSLSQKALARAKASFTGVFYDRYILGKWENTEGLIYQLFANDNERFIIDTPPPIAFCNIGVDFGGNKSAQAFQCTGFLPNLRGVVTLDEYYTKRPVDPAELERDFVAFVKKQQAKYKVMEIFCDSAEQVLIRGLRNALIKEHIGIPVVNSIKGEIIDRIRFYNMLFSTDRYKIMRNCKETISAFSESCWNPKSLKDERLDDGTNNQDTIDAAEYSTERYQKQMIDLMMFGK